ncbi:MAG TPA: hypothetical protein ENN64_01515, partial [bacterium]|nr:hypothetical protein [bacterium]
MSVFIIFFIDNRLNPSRYDDINSEKERVIDRLYKPIANRINETEDANSDDEENNGNEETDEENGERKEAKESAWIPYWGFSSGIKSLEEKADRFYSVSPVIYEVNSNGSLINKKPSNFKRIEEIAEENDILLIPSIALFDWRLFSDIL